MKISPAINLPKLYDEGLSLDSQEWFGFVDSWEPGTGVTGWIFKSSKNRNKIKGMSVELLIDKAVIATAYVNTVRPDISSLVGSDLATGFVFEPDVYKTIARYILSKNDGKIKIRVSGTKALLPSKGTPPTASELIAVWRNSLLSDYYSHHSFARSMNSTNFLKNISIQRIKANAMASSMLVPIKKQEIGFIESICVDIKSLVWLGGWIKKELFINYAAVLVDRSKYISGIGLIYFPRVDVDAEYQGFIGLLETDWQSSNDASDFILYFDTENISFLRADKTTKYISKLEVLKYFDEVASSTSNGDVEGMSSVLESPTSWERSVSNSVIYEPKVSLDKLFLLQGFGCIIEGWLISSVKIPKTFEIKIGNTTLYAHDSTTYYKQRSDLSNAFQLASRLTDSAGFVSVLLGSIPSPNFREYKLKIIYVDGSVSVHEIDSKVVHALDPILDSKEILRLLPTINFESWFPFFCSALHSNIRNAVIDVVPVVKEIGSTKAIIIYWPNNSDGQYLIADDIYRNIEHLELNNIELCLISNVSDALNSLKKIINNIKSSHTKIKVSAYIIPKEELRLYCIPKILIDLGIESFAFLGPNISLRDIGWIAIQNNLKGYSDFPLILELNTGFSSKYSINTYITTDAWAWKTTQFLEFLLKLSPMVSGEITSIKILDELNPIYLANVAVRILSAENYELAEIVDTRTIKNLTDIVVGEAK